MRITHFYPRLDLERAGSLRAALDTAEAATLAGHDVTFATCDGRDAERAWPPGPQPEVLYVGSVGGRSAWLNRVGRRQIADLFRQTDAAHFHGVWDTITLQVAFQARRSKVPYVVSLHGTLQEWAMHEHRLKKLTFLRLAGRPYLDGASVIHTVAGEETRQSLPAMPAGARSSIEAVPYPVDLRSYHTPPGPELARATLGLADGPTVLYLSTLQDRKRPDIVIEAVAHLSASRPRLQAVVAGPGTATEVGRLRRLIDRQAGQDRVVLSGLVAGDLKLSLLQLADVLVLPTSAENFGIVLIEALASGTPVVTTRGTSIWPELEASGGCVIVDQTVAAVGAALGDLLTDDARRRQMSQAGRAWALRTFEPLSMATRYTALYEKAVSAP